MANVTLIYSLLTVVERVLLPPEVTLFEPIVSSMRGFGEKGACHPFRGHAYIEEVNGKCYSSNSLRYAVRGDTDHKAYRLNYDCKKSKEAKVWTWMTNKTHPYFASSSSRFEAFMNDSLCINDKQMTVNSIVAFCVDGKRLGNDRRILIYYDEGMKAWLYDKNVSSHYLIPYDGLQRSMNSTPVYETTIHECSDRNRWLNFEFNAEIPHAVVWSSITITTGLNAIMVMWVACGRKLAHWRSRTKIMM